MCLKFSQLNDAEESGQTALRIARLRDGDSSHRIAKILSVLCAVYRARDMRKEADRMGKMALKMMRLHTGDKSIDTGQILCNMGSYYFVKGSYAKAEALLLKSLDITELLPLYASHAHLHLSSIHRARGDLDKALQSGMCAHKMLKELPHGEEDIIAITSNLAFIRIDMGEKDNALVLLTEVLPITRRFFGEKHGQVVKIYTAIAGIYGYQGRLDEALKIAKKALKYRLQSSPEDTTTMSMADVKTTVAGVYFLQKKYAKALGTRPSRIACISYVLAYCLHSLTTLLHAHSSLPGGTRYRRSLPGDTLYRCAIHLPPAHGARSRQHCHVPANADGSRRSESQSIAVIVGLLALDHLT